MTIQTINIGGYANDGTGDDLRTAFTKVNNNFAQLGSTVGIQNGANLGVGTSIFAQRNNTTANLEFKTLTSTDDSVTITHTDDSVNLAASPNIINDTTPSLGGDLLLNGHIINGQNGTGDVKSTVYTLDVRAMSGMLQVLLQNSTADFGPFVSPAETTISFPEVDMGSFLIPTTNTFDFGTL
jgi:hypothetical protein